MLRALLRSVELGEYKVRKHCYISFLPLYYPLDHCGDAKVWS